ncbi:DMT family transporter [Streptomyces sp. NPDC092296]|uniref:DMT family transporter n=1 Tax=Streptomyces sp. NPDC092296 TaxID=3366012 RepID=UPI00380D56E8
MPHAADRAGQAGGVLVYVLAVLAACANALASVLQRKANRDLPGEDSLRLRLIADLLHRPVWFAGVAAVTAGFVLQAAALAAGQLSVVEPILVIELPLTLMLASRVFRTRLHGREWAASLGMTAGLAALLYFLAPSPGGPHGVAWQAWAIGGTVNLAVVAAAVQWGRLGRPGRRAAAFGVAAGCQFGLTAALIKGMADRYAQGIGAVLTGWPLYAMVASGLLGMFLLQSAMHAGTLVAAQPGLTLSDPLVSILWGVLAFDEQVRTGLPHLVPAVAGGVLMAASVLVLTRAPAFAEQGGAGRPADAGQPESGRTGGARR